MKLVDALSRLQRLDQPVVETGDAAIVLGLFGFDVREAHRMIARIPSSSRRNMVAERFKHWLVEG